MQANQPTQTDIHPAQGTQRVQKVALVTVAVALVLLALIGVIVTNESGDAAGRDVTNDGSEAIRDAASKPGGDGEQTPAIDTGETDEEEPEEDFDGFFDDSDLADPEEGTSPEPVDFGGDEPTPDPCEGHDPDRGALLVTPDPHVLADNDMTDELHVRNCGESSVSWTALTVPKVALADDGGSVLPGQVVPVPFTIDGPAFDPGAIDFKIKVQEPGHSHYADIHAFRQATWADYSATDQLSAGEHAGGCAMQCIVRAVISTGAMSPNVTIDIKTTVPATTRVYLSKGLPMLDQDGNPYFPGVAAKVTSPGPVSSWKPRLTGLQAATTYNIIVKATDGKGDTAYRSGEFKTITPATGPVVIGGNDPEPGCSYQCVTKATMTPGEGLDPSHLSVTSHTPARFQLSLGLSAPNEVNGVPTFGTVEKTVSSGDGYRTAWGRSVSGLAPGTTYYAVLRAEDANGKRSFVTGSFTTDGIDVAVAIHTIHVTQDGDKNKHNRGELSFAWAVGDSAPIGYRDEQKLHHGDTTSIGRHNGWLISDAGTFLPSIRLAAFERDADLKSEFCTMGTGVPTSHGSNGSCDVHWNVATTGIMSPQNISALAECSTMGVDGAYADDRCLVITSADLGSDYPEFWTVVSFRVI